LDGEREARRGGSSEEEVLALARRGASRDKQKARGSAADAWREPSTAPSVASSRAFSPAPGASWAEVAGGSSERSEMMSPGLESQERTGKE